MPFNIPPFLPPGQTNGIPLATIISYAGQIKYINNNKNEAWPECNSLQENPCCAPETAGNLPSPSSSTPIIAIEQTGWMLCDGRMLLLAQYNDLFNVLGYMYGGDESKGEFAIPDCRGLFIRGVDATAGMDVDASARQAANKSSGSSSGVGSLQCDALQKHEHAYNQIPGSQPSVGSYVSAAEGGIPGFISSELTKNASNQLPNTVRTSSETRPVNIAMNYLIKVNNY